MVGGKKVCEIECSKGIGCDGREVKNKCANLALSTLADSRQHLVGSQVCLDPTRKISPAFLLHLTANVFFSFSSLLVAGGISSHMVISQYVQITIKKRQWNIFRSLPPVIVTTYGINNFDANVCDNYLQMRLKQASH